MEAWDARQMQQQPDERLRVDPLAVAQGVAAVEVVDQEQVRPFSVRLR